MAVSQDPETLEGWRKEALTLRSRIDDWDMRNHLLRGELDMFVNLAEKRRKRIVELEQKLAKLGSG